MNTTSLIVRSCPRLRFPRYGAIISLLAAGQAAAGITAGDPLEGGVGYAFQAELGSAESAAQPSHVGAWSWEDQGLFAPGEDPVGWTHTSNWYALTLQSNCLLTLTIERDPSLALPEGGFRPVDSLYPSFTLWSGWDNDAMPDDVALALGYTEAELPVQDHHTYTNDGAVVWAEDLTYLDSLANTTLEAVTRSWTLPAGQYSLVIGSNAPSENSPPRQGYRAVFSTAAVPEPAVPCLLLVAAALGIRRRR